jgi:hypothetical protein
MPNRKARQLSLIALAGAVALISGAAQAQYLTRPYHRSIHHRYYNAHAYMGRGFNVLPLTIVRGGWLGLIQSQYDPYGRLPSVYGCCPTTQKEHIGLVGAGGFSR